MTNDARSGSRWEPEHGPDEATALPATAPRKKRSLAALTATGFALVGGAGGWAIGSVVAGGDSPAVQETSVDDPAGNPDVVPGPPGGGQLPDSGEGRLGPGGRGGMPDRADDGDAA